MPPENRLENHVFGLGTLYWLVRYANHTWFGVPAWSDSENLIYGRGTLYFFIRTQFFILRLGVLSEIVVLSLKHA